MKKLLERVEDVKRLKNLNTTVIRKKIIKEAGKRNDKCQIKIERR